MECLRRRCSRPTLSSSCLGKSGISLGLTDKDENEIRIGGETCEQAAKQSYHITPLQELRWKGYDVLIDKK